VTRVKRLSAVAVSTGATASVLYTLVMAADGYMAGPISMIVAFTAVPIAALATVGWHTVANGTLGPTDSHGATGLDLCKGVGWVFGVSLVAGVGFGLLESSWGVLGFIMFATSGVTYLLCYRFF
jgi:hypothetical protein